MLSPKNTSKNLRWALLIHRGKGMQERFFKNNRYLQSVFQERGIFWLSPLNRPQHDYFINERNAFISYLLAYYPHFKNLTSKEQNVVVNRLLKRFENEDYVEIIWRELNIQGSDGGYVVLFDGQHVTVKFIGLGNWEETELAEFIDSDRFDTPESWLVVDNEWKKSLGKGLNHPSSNKNDVQIQRHYLQSKDADAFNSELIESTSLMSQDDAFDTWRLKDFELQDGNHTTSNSAVGLNSIHHEVLPNFEKMQVLMKSFGEDIPQELQVFLLKIQEYGLSSGLFQFLDVLGSKLPSLSNGNSGMISLMAGKGQLWTKRMAPNLQIDLNYKICFSDEAGELKLEPLHKALYILFLRNLNGILLSDLYLYKNDLLEYYRMLSNSENLERMSKSVNQLVDIRENSIHEKISKINRIIENLFLESKTGVDPKPYFISGARGSAKRILLPAAKIMWV